MRDLKIIFLYVRVPLCHFVKDMSLGNTHLDRYAITTRKSINAHPHIVWIRDIIGVVKKYDQEEDQISFKGLL